MDDELLALALQLEETEAVNEFESDANVALATFREEIAAGFTFLSECGTLTTASTGSLTKCWAVVTAKHVETICGYTLCIVRIVLYKFVGGVRGTGFDIRASPDM
jgi:hypothetical protein